MATLATLDGLTPAEIATIDGVAIGGLANWNGLDLDYPGYAPGITNWWRPSVALSSLDQVGSLDGADVGTITYGASGADVGTDNGFSGFGLPNSIPCPFSWSVWTTPNVTAMNANSYGGWLISHRGNPPHSDHVFQLLYLKSTGKWRASVGSAEATQYTVDSTSAAANATEVHLAATCDGSTLRLYINGVENNTVALGGTRVTTEQKLRFAAMSYDSIPDTEYSYHGTWDNCQLYNGKALSAAEVAAIYAYGR